MKSLVPLVKGLTAAVAIVSAFIILLLSLHQYRRTHLSVLRKFSPGNLREEEWEDFERLPKRFVKNYSPKTNSHKEILMESFLGSQDSGELFSVTFLVNSDPISFQRRNVIRRTWGNVSSFRGFDMNVLFVVGTNQRHQARLKSENKKYRDIVQVNITENAANRPQKLLSTFRWIAYDWRKHSTLYITTKDTCVVNIAATVQYLLTHLEETKQSVHCGFMFENNTGVIRGHGPRSISHSLYPKKTYPAFCRSGFVILGPEYLKKIYDISTVTNIAGFHLEDVLLYGILREKLRIPNSIRNVINGGRTLVYYTWDETEIAPQRMLQKWERWKDELIFDSAGEIYSTFGAQEEIEERTLPQKW